jgi:hypothetical protein
MKIKRKKKCLQNVVQSVRSTPNEGEVSSSNPSLPSCMDMSKKKKKKKEEEKVEMEFKNLTKEVKLTFCISYSTIMFQ